MSLLILFRHDYMFGTTPINHASRTLSKEWTGWTTGPYLGETLTKLLGINYAIHPNLYPQSNGELFSSEFHPQTTQNWWKWLLIKEFMSLPVAEPESSLMFPAWYPFKTQHTSKIHFVHLPAHDTKPNVDYSMVIDMSVIDMWTKKSVQCLIDKLDSVGIWDEHNNFCFSTTQTRYLIEYNAPRKVMNRCFAYDYSKSSDADDTADGSRGLFQLHRSGSFTKIAETGLLPFQIDNMEFNVDALLSNPRISCGHSPILNNTDTDTTKSYTNSTKVNAAHIKWNLYSVLKANVTPLHILLVYINALIEAWESEYTPIRLPDDTGMSMFQSLTNYIDELTYTSINALYLKKGVLGNWLFKYQMYYESLHKSIAFPLSPCIDTADLIQWSYVELNGPQSVLLSVQIIASIFPDFKPFMQLIKAGESTKVEVWVKQLHAESACELANTCSFPVIADLRSSLGENTPFFEFIIRTKPNYLEYSIFWRFIYCITFLTTVIKKSREVASDQTARLVAKDVIGTPFLDLFFNTKAKREATATCPISQEDKDKECFDVLYTRMVTQACHEYLTCFLPLAQFFKEAIGREMACPNSTTWGSLKDSAISTETLHVLMPHPERSFEWTNAPDVRCLLQNVRFTHKTVDGDNTNAIVAMFQKSLPFRSQSRSIGAKISHCCKKNDAMYGLFYCLLRNTLLGMYGDSTLGFGYNKMAAHGQKDGVPYISLSQLPVLYRPSFGTMMCYYEMFFDDRQRTDEQVKDTLIKWIQSDSKICVLVIREFLVSLISIQPQYAESQPSINWRNFWQRSIILGNLIRTTVDNSVRVLYKTGTVIKNIDMLPCLEKKFTFIFSSQGGFDTTMAKQPFMDKLFSIFKEYNESIIINAVVLKGEIPILERFMELLHEKDKCEGVTNETINAIDELTTLITKKREALRACEYDLDNDTKNRIWSSLFGIKTKTNANSINDILEFITPAEVNILYIMMDMCGRNVSPKGIEKIMSKFGCISFKNLHFVLECIYMLQSIQMVMLDKNTTSNIETAMRQRFDMIPGQILPDKAYHIYYTLCCRRIASHHPNIRNYGNNSIIYDPYNKMYTCGKKKLKKMGPLLISGLVNKTQLNVAKSKATKIFFEKYGKYINLIENTETVGPVGKNLSEDTYQFYSISKELFPFSHLEDKAKKKVARTIRRRSQLDCLHNPPVLTLDIRGYRLIEGRPDKKKKAYQHCPQCGHFHKYSDKYWSYNGGEYTCSHCWTENTTFMAKCGYCHKYELKRPDKISTIMPSVTPICRTGGSMAAACHDDATRIWLSSIEAVANLRRTEIMTAANESVDSDLSKKYNAIVSDTGKFFVEEDYDGATDMDDDPDNDMAVSEDLGESDDYLISFGPDSLDTDIIQPKNNDPTLDNNTSQTPRVQGKTRLKYRRKGKNSKRFGINTHAASTYTTRSSSAKHEELLPHYASREALMVDRCSVERLTERMLKALRRNGRVFLVDMGNPSAVQLKLILSQYQRGGALNRDQLIYARLNSHIIQEETTNTKDMFNDFFNALYCINGAGKFGINLQLANNIATSGVMPIIVASLCDLHAPNMNDIPYSIDGTTRKKRYYGHNMQNMGRRDPIIDGYKSTNDFQTLLNFNLMSGDDYYRAIEKKRMNTCRGLAGYESRGRSFKRKNQTDSARDDNRRKLADILLKRTSTRLNEVTASINKGIKRTRDGVPKTDVVAIVPTKANGKVKTKDEPAPKKRKKVHWLSKLESSAKSKKTADH